MLEATVRVRSEVPAPVTGLVPKFAATPAGRPDAEKETAESKPFTALTLMVELPLFPCATEREVGEAEREKFGAVDAPTNAVIRLAPFMLPQPVTRS